jgi:uncharacterized repeat protein (TIGR02543 family)
MKKRLKFLSFPLAALTALIFSACPAVTDDAGEPDPGPENDVIVFQFLSPGAETAADPMRVLLPKSGGSVDKPSDPARKGYSFIGWFTAAEEGEEVSDSQFPLSVKKDSSLYARWDPVVFTIRFEAGAGATNIQDDISLTYPTTRLGSRTIESPVLADHDFEGWFTTEQYTTPFDGNTDIVDLADTDGIVRVYAKWAAHINVIFNPNNGAWSGDSAPREVQAVQGQALGSLPPNPERAGYVFLEWNRSQDGTGAAFTASTVVSDAATFSVYARWGKILTVSFDPDGGHWSGDSTVRTASITPPATALSAGQFPPDPANADSTLGFAGWFDTMTTGGNRFTTSTRPSDDIIVYARWGQLSTVTFDANGGSFTGGALTQTTTAFTGGNLSAFPTPSRTGHRLTGWNDQSDGSGTPYTLASIIPGNIIIYAQWVVSNAAYTIFEYSNTVDGAYIPDNLADGNTGTWWQTTQLPQFNHLDLALVENDPAGKFGFRHWATVDLGQVVTGLTKLRYHDRPGSSTGDIIDCDVYASEEVNLKINIERAVDAGKAQKIGEARGWAQGSTVGWREISFTQPVNARFVQIRVLASGTQNAMSISEVELYAGAAQVPVSAICGSSGNQGQTGMYPANAMDGSITNNYLTAQLTSYLNAATADAAKAVLLPYLPPDYHFDVGHWVTIDLGVPVSSLQGIRIQRRNDGRYRINDVDIYASADPIYGMGTATQNVNMFFVRSASQHPVNSNAWTIDFTTAVPVRYLHIRVHSAYFGSENYGTDFGFASASEIEVLK